MHATTRALGYYAAHGPMTHPGRHADLLEGLPAGVPGLARAVRGAVEHRQVPEVPDARLREIRAHSAEEMLGRIRDLDGRPLVEGRPPEKRTVGNCSHAATLFCSLLRQKGVPARVRDGFAAYLVPDLWCNHWVAEYWDGAEGRWARADAELQEGSGEVLGPTFDPHDLPRDRFVDAGEAWSLCRAGGADPDLFGYPGATGTGYVAQRVALDLAALNKVELTPYDRWGFLEKREDELSADDLALLDRVAGLTSGGGAAPAELRAVYEGDGRLRVPAAVAYRDEKGAETYPIPGSRPA